MAAIEVSPGALLSFLQLSCSRANNQDNAWVSRCGILDCLERFGPTCSRATLSRKLGRVLQQPAAQQTLAADNCQYMLTVLPVIFSNFSMNLIGGGRKWGWIQDQMKQRARPSNAQRSVSMGGSQSTLSDLSGALGETGSGAGGALQMVSLPSPSDPAASPASGLEFEAASAGSVGEAATSTDGAHTEAASSRGKRRKCPPARSLDEYQRMFDGSSRDDLLQEIMLRDEQLQSERSSRKRKEAEAEASKKRLKLQQQQLRRVTGAKHKLAAKAKAKQAKLLSSSASAEPGHLERRMAIERTGHCGTGRYLTVPSRVSLAIRRNLSNAACGDVSLILLDEASRWTIARSEVQSGAALIASARSFHRDMQEELSSADALSIHMITQDATNSAIWQKRKLCALILHSAYLVSPPDPAAHFVWNWRGMFSSLQCVADVQQVSDGTGAGSVGLTTKMLESLGCPTAKTLSARYRLPAESGPAPHSTAQQLGRLFSCLFHIVSCGQCCDSIAS